MTVPRLLLLLLLLAVASSGASSRTNQRVPSNAPSCPHGDELKLVVTGAQNGTGLPRVQAYLEQPAGRPPWRLDVGLRDAPCAHGESRRVMQVTVQGPIEGEYLPTAQRLQQLQTSGLSEIEVLEASVALPPSNSSRSGTLHPRRRHINDSIAEVDEWEMNEVAPRFEGYTKINNVGRYKVQEEKANWTRASKICHREGATLALPNSQAEADAMWTLKQNAAPTRADNARGFFGLSQAAMLQRAYLVGARRLVHNINYTTIFGEELHEAGYDTWAVPPLGPEDCVAMYEKMGFFGVSCELEMSFICELPL